MVRRSIINRIDFNWFADAERGPGHDTYNVGDGGVTSITDVSDHPQQICYRVVFADDTVVLVFNPNLVFLKPIEE